MTLGNKPIALSEDDMPNQISSNVGGHDYPDGGGVQNCKHKCGCYRSGFSLNGPDGIDPRGPCPKNLYVGGFVGTEEIYRELLKTAQKSTDMLEREIANLTNEVARLREELKVAREHSHVEDAEFKLACEVARLKRKLEIALKIITPTFKNI